MQSYLEGNVQKTEKIIFEADKKNSITLNIPKEVTLHYDGKKFSNKKLRLLEEEVFILLLLLITEKT